MEGIDIEDLKIFETIQEITGSLIFGPGDNLPGLTSVDVFKNLKKVRGSDSDG